MAEYIDLVNTEAGTKFVRVRKDTDEILDELRRSISHLKDKLIAAEDKVSEVMSEKYKDDELRRMSIELDKLKSERFNGFVITDEELEAIEDWKDDWFNRKRGGDHYMGACGGGFVYRFHPTTIGASGVVVAPDGEEFTFRELG